VNFLKMLVRSFTYFVYTVKDFLKGQITFKYAIIKLYSQITRIGRRFVDGVDWQTYSKHYEEELKILAKKYIDRLSRSDGIYLENKIHYNQKNRKVLHPNHELLYETILQTKINDLMEIGVGGGDHLVNLKQLNENLKLIGIDLSDEQINLLRKRNPELIKYASLHTKDITDPAISLPKASLVYTQAVLMHISEKQNRFQTALTNVFISATQCVVMMENWTQHNFLSAVKSEIAKNSSWKNSFIYYNSSRSDPKTRCMIISKNKLEFEPLTGYEQLLIDKRLEIH
jgi:trans-aconitate methyltransferase